MYRAPNSAVSDPVMTCNLRPLALASGLGPEDCAPVVAWRSDVVDGEGRVAAVELGSASELEQEWKAEE